MASANAPQQSAFEASDYVPDLSEPTTYPRLFAPPKQLLAAAVKVGAATGLFLGATHGARTAALRFRAEHTHKLPTSTKGWYLYHKSKNYNMMLSGVKEGILMGCKLGFWVGAFFAVEASVDRMRGDRKDFASTTTAGLSVAGAFSVWNRFPLATAARTAKMGLMGGLVYGISQDVLTLARGRSIAYVDFLLGRGSQLEQSPNE